MLGDISLSELFIRNEKSGNKEAKTFLASHQDPGQQDHQQEQQRQQPPLRSSIPKVPVHVD
ncbi:hypothetical protein CC2G_012053 [Coprinopsis cinerea AmutBmut pab1-1]|nr:hypothetical protein CC2G_012053 [Coprinopsis cinerea AmutBmut pab1-1]